MTYCKYDIILLYSFQSLTGSASGHHGGFNIDTYFGSHGGHGLENTGTNCFNVYLCPDLLMGAFAFAFAAIYYIIYEAVTMAARRRRKRSIGTNASIVFEMLTLGKQKADHNER